MVCSETQIPGNGLEVISVCLLLPCRLKYGTHIDFRQLDSHRKRKDLICLICIMNNCFHDYNKMFMVFIYAYFILESK